MKLNREIFIGGVLGAIGVIIGAIIGIVPFFVSRHDQIDFLTQTAVIKAMTPTDTPSPTPTFDLNPFIDATLTAQARLWTPTPTLPNVPTMTPAPTQFAACFERNFNGVIMVFVPEGCFKTGDNSEVTVTLCLQAFWIDKYEVTNAQFDRKNGKAQIGSFWKEADRPCERITWFEARDFCALHNARLPTDFEWEYAARGPENALYPWGNSFSAEDVVFGNNSNGQTAFVGSRPDGKSWVGAMDMSGNVWEWVSSIYASENNHANLRRSLRGGSWLSALGDVRATSRNWGNPNDQGYDAGFRCVRDV